MIQIGHVRRAKSARLSLNDARALLPAGAAVEVSNADGTAHTLTARDGAFDTGAVDAGTTVAFTAPAAPGTYDYFCAIHPSMTGSLVVN